MSDNVTPLQTVKFKGALLDRAFNDLLTTHGINALTSEPHHLFGALMMEIQSLKTRLERLENTHGESP